MTLDRIKKLCRGKVLYFDIETRPMEVYTFYIGNKVSISPSQIIKETKIITIAYMFEGDKHASVLTWDKNQDDAKMLRKFTEILNKAEIVIGQNSDKFDLKVLNWRLNVLGLKPIAPILSIDTLKLSRQAFSAPSHRLDYRSKIYGLGGKIKMELKDWINVINRIPGALEKMAHYNKKDVTDLRSLFWREFPFYKRLPVQLSILLNNPEKPQHHCPECGSCKIQKRGVRLTRTKKHQRYQCQDCARFF